MPARGSNAAPRWCALYDLEADPGEFTDLSERHPQVAQDFQRKLLQRFRETHPEASEEPSRGSPADPLDYYLRPRDAAPVEG